MTPAEAVHRHRWLSPRISRGLDPVEIVQLAVQLDGIGDRADGSWWRLRTAPRVAMPDEWRALVDRVTAELARRHPERVDEIREALGESPTVRLWTETLLGDELPEEFDELLGMEVALVALSGRTIPERVEGAGSFVL